MYLVIPSTLILGSCTKTLGFATEQASISPLRISDLKRGRFLMQMQIWNFDEETWFIA